MYYPWIDRKMRISIVQFILCIHGFDYSVNRVLDTNSKQEEWTEALCRVYAIAKTI